MMYYIKCHIWGQLKIKTEQKKKCLKNIFTIFWHLSQNETRQIEQVAKRKENGGWSGVKGLKGRLSSPYKVREPIWAACQTVAKAGADVGTCRSNVGGRGGRGGRGGHRHCQGQAEWSCPWLTRGVMLVLVGHCYECWTFLHPANTYLPRPIHQDLGKGYLQSEHTPMQWTGYF